MNSYILNTNTFCDVDTTDVRNQLLLGQKIQVFFLDFFCGNRLMNANNRRLIKIKRRISVEILLTIQVIQKFVLYMQLMTHCVVSWKQ